jgi:hypothetical protein
MAVGPHSKYRAFSKLSIIWAKGWTPQEVSRASIENISGPKAPQKSLKKAPKITLKIIDLNHPNQPKIFKN